MADWFRWWHGSVTDPKFGVVSMRAKCDLAHVLAVWAMLLEHASQADDRGDISGVTAEEIAWTLRMDTDVVSRIMEAMDDRGLTAKGRMEGWDRRQPMREDAISPNAKTGAQRQREYRDRRRNADVTRSNAYVTPQSRADTEQIQSKPYPSSSVVVDSTGVAPEEKRPAALLGATPDIPEPTPTRRGLVCRLLRQAGVSDAAPHHLTDENWDALLARRTDEEIVEFAKAKLDARAGQRTGLKYLAPGLLQDPDPISTGPPARASPRMNARDAGRLAAARTIFGTEIEAHAHGSAAADRTIDVTPTVAGTVGLQDLRRDAG